MDSTEEEQHCSSPKSQPQENVKRESESATVSNKCQSYKQEERCLLHDCDRISCVLASAIKELPFSEIATSRVGLADICNEQNCQSLTENVIELTDELDRKELKIGNGDGIPKMESNATLVEYSLSTRPELVGDELKINENGDGISIDCIDLTKLDLDIDELKNDENGGETSMGSNITSAISRVDLIKSEPQRDETVMDTTRMELERDELTNDQNGYAEKVLNIKLEKGMDTTRLELERDGLTNDRNGDAEKVLNIKLENVMDTTRMEFERDGLTNDRNGDPEMVLNIKSESVMELAKEELDRRELTIDRNGDAQMETTSIKHVSRDKGPRRIVPLVSYEYDTDEDDTDEDVVMNDIDDETSNNTVGRIKIEAVKTEDLQDSGADTKTSTTDSSSSSEEDDSSQDETSSEVTSSGSDDDDEEEEHRIEFDLEEKSIKVPPAPATATEVQLEELPDVEYINMVLDEQVEVRPLGLISSIIGQLVIVKSFEYTPALDTESVLFKEDRQALGRVFEVFGPVNNPMYSMRFNSVTDITTLGIRLQLTLFYAPSSLELTAYVFMSQLLKMKGSDASWMGDEEPPPDLVEYSDDEQEKQAKRKHKKDPQKRKIPSKRSAQMGSVNESRDHVTENAASRHRHDHTGNRTNDCQLNRNRHQNQAAQNSPGGTWPRHHQYWPPQQAPPCPPYQPLYQQMPTYPPAFPMNRPPYGLPPPNVPFQPPPVHFPGHPPPGVPPYLDTYRPPPPMWNYGPPCSSMMNYPRPTQLGNNISSQTANMLSFIHSTPPPPPPPSPPPPPT